MSPTNGTISITDQLGTEYADLFDDIDLGAASSAAQVEVVSSPHSPRANADGPLGALIVRWIQARVESPTDRFAWQYVDATDTHTIAFVVDQEIQLVNIFGRIDRGNRVYGMRDLAEALHLQFHTRQAEGGS